MLLHICFNFQDWHLFFIESHPMLSKIHSNSRPNSTIFCWFLDNGMGAEVCCNCYADQWGWRHKGVYTMKHICVLHTLHCFKITLFDSIELYALDFNIADIWSISTQIKAWSWSFYPIVKNAHIFHHLNFEL